MTQNAVEDYNKASGLTMMKKLKMNIENFSGNGKVEKTQTMAKVQSATAYPSQEKYYAHTTFQDAVIEIQTR